MYKCPWQPLTEEIFHSGNKTTRTFFSDCLKTNCPWWRDEVIYSSGFISPGCCMRPTNEKLEK